jgi:N-acetylglucosaminyldiphosphoundecaprenol N-acetyl-beta-D-mannosaminyltransferase
MNGRTGQRVFGIQFSELAKDELVLKATESQPVGAGVRLFVTTNLDHVVNLVKNREFRNAYGAAWLATADGFPIYIYAKLRRSPVRERVSGADFFAALMPALRPGAHRPYFVVSSEQTVAATREWLLGRGFEAAAVGFFVPELGFENDIVASTQLAERIRAHRTTHLVLGVGSPKSEVWVYNFRDKLGDLWAFGVGASVDFFVGIQRRAPAWMQAAGLEWAWRVAREPRRLWKRYFVDSWMIFAAVWNDLRTGGQAPVPLKQVLLRQNGSRPPRSGYQDTTDRGCDP